MDILILPPYVELNTDTPQNTWICGVQVWFQFEKVAEKSDRRLDAKENFTEMNKDRKMQDGVRVQMIQGYAIIVQKPMQKGKSRQPQPMLDERHKKNNLTWLKVGNTVLSRCLPFPMFLLRQIALFMELQEMLRLRYRR